MSELLFIIVGAFAVGGVELVTTVLDTVFVSLWADVQKSMVKRNTTAKDVKNVRLSLAICSSVYYGFG
jgi:hypothetical protein